MSLAFEAQVNLFTLPLDERHPLAGGLALYVQGSQIFVGNTQYA